MKILFNKTFFKFVLGFTGIVALGIVGIAIVGMQTLDAEDAQLAEAAAR
jgi:hypothetical protein